MQEYSVLIVEDDPIIVRILYSMLEYGKFHVTTPVDSGEQVFEQVTLERPDIVLMDIDLPGSISGINTASILFRIFVIPVIFVTGHDEDKILNEALSSMPFGFLIKPVNPTLLNSSVKVGVNMCRMIRQTTEGSRAGLSDSMISRLTLACGYHILVDDYNRILLANQSVEELLQAGSSDLFFKDLEDILKKLIPEDVMVNGNNNEFLQNQRSFIINMNDQVKECTIIIEPVYDLFGKRSGSFISLMVPV